MKKINLAWFLKWSIWTIFANIKQFIYAINRGYQRARYGISAADTWNLDDYIARVIANGCRYLKEHANGFPYGYTEETWSAKLEEIAQSADKMTNLCYEKEDFDKFFNLLKENFEKLWD